VEQLGAGSRPEGVEALTEFALELLEVHGSHASIRRPRRGPPGHGPWTALEGLTLATCRHSVCAGRSSGTVQGSHARPHSLQEMLANPPTCRLESP
jgi:hypothetical protein